jgi:hypothetical protein
MRPTPEGSQGRALAAERGRCPTSRLAALVSRQEVHEHLVGDVLRVDVPTSVEGLQRLGVGRLGRLGIALLGQPSLGSVSCLMGIGSVHSSE